MDAKEFKAWLDGYTEALTGPPTAEQFERIKRKVAELSDGKPAYTGVRGPAEPYGKPYWRESTAADRVFGRETTAGATITRDQMARF